jgi:hypothetical protein
MPAVVGVAVLGGLLLASGIPSGDSGARPDAGTAAGRAPIYPSSMDALGASNTVGFNTDCPDAWMDCPDNSWATGTNPAVDSVYQRLLALDPQLAGNNANDAESGTAWRISTGRRRRPYGAMRTWS